MSIPEDRLEREANPTPGEKAGFVPQHRVMGTRKFETTEGKNGHMSVRSNDGEHETMGATTDEETADTLVGIGKRKRSLLQAILTRITGNWSVSVTNQVTTPDVSDRADRELGSVTAKGLGAATDDEAEGNGSLIAVTKKNRTLLGQILTKLGAVVISAGSAIIGKVGIDQTTDGSTNRVVAKISQANGENVVKLAAGDQVAGKVGIDQANGQNVVVLGAKIPAGDQVIGKVGIDATVNTVKVAEAGAAITGAIIPAGGSGLLGWLSAIWTRLAGVTLAVSDVIIGRVKLTDGATVAAVDAATGGVKTVAQGTTAVDVKSSNTAGQPLISRAMDFAGKTAGLTWDIPHVAKLKVGANFDAPATFATEFSATQYGNIAVLDGTPYALSNAVNSNYVQHLFSFDVLAYLKIKGDIPAWWDVTKLKANFKQAIIDLYAWGVGSNAGVSTNGVKVRVWNGTTASWNEWSSHAGSTPTRLPATAIPNANFIDPNGFIHLNVHPSYPSDGVIPSTIYTDYPRIEVQLYTELQQTNSDRAFDETKKALRAVTEITGDFRAIASGVSGLKTVTTTAAELFAGASARLAKRTRMVVYCPLTAAEPILWGFTAAACNMTILPGNGKTFVFNPGVAVPIYSKSATASVPNVETWEEA